MKHFLSGLVLLCMFQLPLLAAETAVIEPDTAMNLTQRSDAVKKQVIELNRDLFLLEEDLLHPASTRLAVYISMDYGSFFKLEGVKLKTEELFCA